MIKERNNGSQSPRLSFLGFFVLGSASRPILSRLLFSSCPDSTFGAACLHPFYAASNIPSIPPYLIFLPIFPFSLKLSPLPFPLKVVRTCTFKIKLSEVPEAKPLVSYLPLTKAELGAIVKDFPKVTKDPLGRWRNLFYTHSNLSPWFL